MLGVTTETYRIETQRQSLYVTMIDCLFYLILLAGPFATVWINKETGEGRYLSQLIMLFGLLTIPIWKRYYSKWRMAIVLNFAALTVGLLVDVVEHRYGYVPFNILFISTRQITIGIFYTLIVYNMILRDNRNIKRFIYIVLTSALISSFFMVLNIGIKESTEGGTTGIRYAVLGQNSNATARIAVCGILTSFMLFVSDKRMKMLKKVFFSFTGIICMLALVKAASRGGFLCLLLTFPFCIFTTKSASKKLAYVVLTAMALSLAIFAVLQSDMLRERLLKTFIERDTGGREAIFYTAIAIFKKAPMLGYGNFAHSRVLGEWLGINKQILTHNMYTFPLLAMGIVGSVPYFLSFMKILKSAIRVRLYMYGNCVFVCTLFALLSGMVGNLEYLRDFYVLFGVGLALDKLTERPAALPRWDIIKE